MRKSIILSLLSGILLSLPWLESFSGLILLIAFIPLLILEDEYSKSGKKGLWKYVSLSFIVWNAITTWWIMHATFGGMIFAILGNSAQMILVFMLFHIVKKNTNKIIGYTAFIVFWIAWEYFYLDAEISWPWLMLGNGFGKDIRIVQWYEITGALGGTLWVLLTNVFLFHILKRWIQPLPESPKTKIKPRLAFLASFKAQVVYLILLIAVPCIYSIVRFYTYKEQQKPCNVAILQPNIDPFVEKFGTLSPREQQDIIMNLADSVVTDSTDYVIAPETAFDNHIWVNAIDRNPIITRIKDFCYQHPRVKFIGGAMTSYEFKENEKLSYTARKFYGADKYYDVYNSAFQVDTSSIQLYHKSKLVVGVEMLPYPQYLKFVKKLSINLGGSSGGLGTQEERVAFISDKDEEFKAGPIICYESIYGEFVTEYVHKGANMLFIITNDGWWRNTPGHRQHLHYARLRAIETRRSIARSANTGISAIINQRGEIEQRSNWWVRTALSGTINANDKITPYVKWGDSIGRLATFITILIAIYAISRKLITFRSTNKKS